MSKSSEHLKAAITGETNASAKYVAFANAAEAENLPNVAYLFRTLSEAEKIHIRNHRKALGDEDFEVVVEEATVGTTLQNLEAGIAGEIYENKTMYPGFIKDVKKEMKTDQGKMAGLSMQWALKVEAVHEGLLKQALAAVQAGHDSEITKLWICKICGNVLTEAESTETCSVCGHDAKYYQLIEG
jgi:rubrerythrin